MIGFLNYTPKAYTTLFVVHCLVNLHVWHDYVRKLLLSSFTFGSASGPSPNPNRTVLNLNQQFGPGFGKTP
jgi:hypothetical protein